MKRYVCLVNAKPIEELSGIEEGIVDASFYNNDGLSEEMFGGLTYAIPATVGKMGGQVACEKHFEECPISWEDILATLEESNDYKYNVIQDEPVALAEGVATSAEESEVPASTN